MPCPLDPLGVKAMNGARGDTSSSGWVDLNHDWLQTASRERTLAALRQACQAALQSR